MPRNATIWACIWACMPASGRTGLHLLGAGAAAFCSSPPGMRAAVAVEPVFRIDLQVARELRTVEVSEPVQPLDEEGLRHGVGIGVVEVGEFADLAPLVRRHFQMKQVTAGARRGRSKLDLRAELQEFKAPVPVAGKGTPAVRYGGGVNVFAEELTDQRLASRKEGVRGFLERQCDPDPRDGDVEVLDGPGRCRRRVGAGRLFVGPRGFIRLGKAARGGGFALDSSQRCSAHLCFWVGNPPFDIRGASHAHKTEKNDTSNRKKSAENRDSVRS